MENTTPQAPKKSSNKTVIIIVVIVVILVILGIVGSILSGLFAKKVAEKTTESIISGVTNGAVDVDTKNNSVTITGEDGTTTTIGSKLPNNFPSDIPVYPGATVTSSSVTNGDAESVTSSATLSTSDSLEKVKAYYDGQLSKDGWTQQDSLNLGSIVNYVVTKNNRQLAVTITPLTNDSTVAVSLVESKKE